MRRLLCWAFGHHWAVWDRPTGELVVIEVDGEVPCTRCYRRIPREELELLL